MTSERTSAIHEKRVGALLGRGYERRLKLIGGTHLLMQELEAQRLGRSLRARPGLYHGDCRLPQEGHARNGMHHLLEQLEALTVELPGQIGQPCHVPPWSREALDESRLHRIERIHHHNGEGTARVAGRYGVPGI